MGVSLNNCTNRSTVASLRSILDLKEEWPIKIKIVVVSQSDCEVHKSQSRVLTAIRGRNETAMNVIYSS